MWHLCILAILIVFILGLPVSSVQAAVIYHAFNAPFRTVIPQLARLKRIGYSHIQISPPQASHPGQPWYFRYQPIDHRVIDSPLGNEADLQALIQAAHYQGLKVIVDVVFNHMADTEPFSRTLTYPRFSAQHFHPKQCIDFNDRTSVLRGWLGEACNLPDLATEQPYVRNEAKTYVKKLLSLGVDGLRIDAIKHLEPEFMQDLMTIVPSDTLVYGETLLSYPLDPEDYQPYTRLGRVLLTDYTLARTLQRAFGDGGDLRQLADPHFVEHGWALPGAVAVTFAQSHDTAKNTVTGYQWGDRRDVLLANAFLLARADGVPLIYGGDPQSPQANEPADSSLSDAFEPIVQAGIAFHERFLDHPQYFIPGAEIAPGADNPNTLFLRRGQDGLVILNKANTFFDLTVARMPNMAIGCYQELQYRFPVSIERGDDGHPYIRRWGTSHRGGVSIGPREALFLVKTSQQFCPQDASP